MRAVASLEISNPGGAIVVYVLRAVAPGPFGRTPGSECGSWGRARLPGVNATPRRERDRLNLFPTTSE